MSVDRILKSSKYATYWRRGLGARRQQDKINKRITAKRDTPICGSMDVDAAAASEHKNAHRWDYLFGVGKGNASAAVFVEVHPATNGQAKRIIEKLSWLRSFVAKELPRLPRKPPYYWVGTNGVYVGQRKKRELATHGISVKGYLELKP